MKNRWRFLGFVGFLLLFLPTLADAQDYRRFGGGVFINYNMPLFALRDGWYTKSAKWGATLLHSMDSRVTMEFEYHRANYHNGKIEDRTFLWAVDGKQYKSPRAAADMEINTVVINFLVRLGDQSDLFQAQKTSPYVTVGGGFYDYNNTLSGLIFPAQSAEPLDMSLLLEPQQDTRTALGMNWGLGAERFLTKNLALDFRIRYNFILGQLNSREAWEVKEAWPLQMLDFGIAVRFYESGR